MQVYDDKIEFGWDGDGGLGERLIQQILTGQKIATCSFKIEYTAAELAQLRATKGRLVTVVGHRGTPRCNIRMLDVFETTYGNPDARLIAGEGYGHDVARFQSDHAEVWRTTVKDAPLTAETVLMVELFELAETPE